MNRELRDGLVIDNSVFIIDEKKPGFSLSARIFQFLAIIIGSWSSISVFLEALAVPVDTVHINLAILITTGLMFALCLIPSYDVVKQFFGALFYVLFFYSRLSRIKNGFYIIENAVINRMTSYYGYQNILYKADYSAVTTDTTLLVIMILIPIVALLTVAIIRNKYVSLSSLLLFVPVSVSFLFGLIPSERYLIAYVISVLYLTKSGSSFHHIVGKEQKTLLHRINSRAAVWLSLIGMLLFFLVKLFVTQQEYNNISEIKELKTEMQTALFNFSIEDFTKRFTDFRFPGNNVSAGGLGGGELGKTGEVKFTNSEQLLVTAPLSSIAEGIYLKGYVGSIYTGDKWVGHEKQDKQKYQALLKQLQVEEFPPVNQVNMLLNQVLDKKVLESGRRISVNGAPKLPEYNISQGKMRIDYLAANKKYLYAPYFTNYQLLEQANYQQDLYSAPTVKNDNYEFDYFFNLTLGNPPLGFFSQWQETSGDYAENEKLYRNFVYQVYTKLPEEGLERLKQDFSAANVQTATNSITERIEYVKSYLNTNTQYSLSPGKLPKGKDYVEYFLYENKVGYCAHYASAATLMLRAMGIPARYVEGYAVGSSGEQQSVADTGQTISIYSENESKQIEALQTQISVRDYNAHAWVEVYVNNCGWIPVEFTPGTAIEFNFSVMEDLSLAENYLDQEEEKPALPTDIPEEPTLAPNKQEENQTVDKPKEVIAAESNNQVIKIDILFFILLGAFFTVLGAMILVLRINKRRRERQTANPNKTAIILFAEIEKILASGHGFFKKGNRLEDNEEYVIEHCSNIDPAVFKDCMETVRKARFGKGRITSEELMEVELFRRNLYQEVCQDLPLGKKFYLRFILLM